MRLSILLWALLTVPSIAVGQTGQAERAAPEKMPEIPETAPRPVEDGRRLKMVVLHDEDKCTWAISDLSFTSAQRGVAVGPLPCDNRLRSYAMQTTDGGATWRPLPTKDLPTQTFFLDESRGYLVADRALWWTAEGGAKWEKRKLPKKAGRVYFLNEQTGWAYGAGKIFWRTADGGRTWTEVPESTGLSLTDETTSFGDMAFIDGKTGMIVGNSQPKRAEDAWKRGERMPDWMDPQSAMYRRQYPGTIVLLETKDGGQTWKSSMTSAFGRVTRLSMGGVRGLAVFNYNDQFEYPSEIMQLDFKSGTNRPVFRRKNVRVTDALIRADGSMWVTGIEYKGRLKTSPIPGKVSLFYSRDGVDWVSFPVDYKANGRTAYVSAPDDQHVWVATDEGQILRVQQAGDSKK